MSWTTEFLPNLRRIIKLHDSMLKEVCEEYQLMLIEGTIISFLHNHPGKDTAADIVELRMLSKGNVSQAVESLIQKSLLKRSLDPQDRRKIHLSLTPEAQPMIESLENLWQEFEDQVFFGISEEEKALFDRLNDQIRENTKYAMARRDKHE